MYDIITTVTILPIESCSLDKVNIGILASGIERDLGAAKYAWDILSNIVIGR